MCSYKTNRSANLKRHRNRMHSQHTCIRCHKTFSSKRQLSFHYKNGCGISKFKCTYCDYSSVRFANIKLHMRRMHTEESESFKKLKTLRKCPQCELKFDDLELLDYHLENSHPLPERQVVDDPAAQQPQQGLGPGDVEYEDPCEIQSALKGDIMRYRYRAQQQEHNLREYIERLTPELQTRLEEQLTLHHSVRFYLVAQIRFVRPPGEYTFPSPWFHGGCHTLLQTGNTTASFNR